MRASGCCPCDDSAIFPLKLSSDAGSIVMRTATRVRSANRWRGLAIAVSVRTGFASPSDILSPLPGEKQTPQFQLFTNDRLWRKADAQELERYPPGTEPITGRS